MNKYQYTDKCANIHCGDDSEPVCRKMVIAGVEWLDEHPDVNDGGESFRKALVTASGRGIGGCESSLMLVSILHARRAKTMGWDAYIQRLEQEAKKEEKNANNNKVK
jgi:hypothetical protein